MTKRDVPRGGKQPSKHLGTRLDPPRFKPNDWKSADVTRIGFTRIATVLLSPSFQQARLSQRSGHPSMLSRQMPCFGFFIQRGGSDEDPKPEKPWPHMPGRRQPGRGTRPPPPAGFVDCSAQKAGVPDPQWDIRQSKKRTLPQHRRSVSARVVGPRAAGPLYAQPAWTQRSFGGAARAGLKPPGTKQNREWDATRNDWGGRAGGVQSCGQRVAAAVDKLVVLKN